MASFAPPTSGRGIPPPGVRPRPGMSGPMRGNVPPVRGGVRNPYGAQPQRPGLPSQRAITPEILASLARRRLGG